MLHGIRSMQANDLKTLVKQMHGTGDNLSCTLRCLIRRITLSISPSRTKKLTLITSLDKRAQHQTTDFSQTSVLARIEMIQLDRHRNRDQKKSSMKENPKTSKWMINKSFCNRSLISMGMSQQNLESLTTTLSTKQKKQISKQTK